MSEQNQQTLVEKLENYRDTQTDFEATFTDAVIDRELLDD